MKNSNKQNTAPLALTIAGSDCSGGAGLEADLKTFSALGVYGMAAVTCVVAEQPRKVVSITPIPPARVAEQIACCLQGMRGVPVKTGMLHAAPIIRAASRSLKAAGRACGFVTVDPVMIATSGRRLLRADAIHALEDLLADLADLVTPNMDEVEILAGRRIATPAEAEEAARRLGRRFGCAVLLKGGHGRDPRRASDFFWDGRSGVWLHAPRIQGVRTHGTGCACSAAITAGLARGLPLAEAVRRAKRFVTRAIRGSLRFGPWMALNHLG